MQWAPFILAENAQNKEKYAERAGKTACGGERYAHARGFIHAARLLIWSFAPCSFAPPHGVSHFYGPAKAEDTRECKNEDEEGWKFTWS